MKYKYIASISLPKNPTKWKNFLNFSPIPMKTVIMEYFIVYIYILILLLLLFHTIIPICIAPNFIFLHHIATPKPAIHSPTIIFIIIVLLNNLNSISDSEKISTVFWLLKYFGLFVIKMIKIFLCKNYPNANDLNIYYP